MDSVSMQAGTDITYNDADHTILIASSGLYFLSWHAFIQPGPASLINSLVYLEDSNGKVYAKSGVALNSLSKTVGTAVIDVEAGTVLRLVNRSGATLILISAVSPDLQYYCSGAITAFRIA